MIIGKRYFKFNRKPILMNSNNKRLQPRFTIEKGRWINTSKFANSQLGLYYAKRKIQTNSSQT